jgi:hypothetical protein
MSISYELDGSNRSIGIGQGFAVRAPGLEGEAVVYSPSTGDTRGPEVSRAAFDDALRNQNMTQQRTVELKVRKKPGAGSSSVRGPNGDDAIVLEAPDPGRDIGQVVLSFDEAGVATWHFARDQQMAIEPATRGGGGKRIYYIPRDTTGPASTPGADANRSLIGTIGKRLLKVLVYPLTDPVVGLISENFVEAWEKRHRPYGVRPVSASDFARSDVAPLDPGGWQSLGEGKSLLLIHGTFSTAHAAFGGMPADVMQQLCDRYRGRVWAFNHFTLSHDPKKNVDRLLEQIPAGAKLDVDIVCHSRGGLVSRCLAREAAKGSALKIDRVVLVGVPNAGTLLADPDRMMHMIDRFTTILNFFPDGGVSETLESIITAVKIVAHGALRGLDGLASMNPSGTFLKGLNAGTSKSNYYAIAADYSPTDQNLKRFLTGTVNAVADRVFENNANDLVVPTAGVFEKNGAAGFPVEAARVFKFPAEDGVMHTQYFSSAKTCENLLDWLS